MKRLILALILCVAAGLGCGVYLLLPAGGDATAVVNIRKGESLRSVANHLEELGVIRDQRALIMLASLSGATRHIKAGKYELSGRMSPWKILKILREGRVQRYKISIPEGYNIYQIDELLAEREILAPGEFERAAKDKELLSSMGIEGESFEGYLFPDTYYIDSGMGAKEIIKMMVQRFQEIFTPEMKQRLRELGMSLKEVITLASLVEKETAVPEEKPLVAAVFYNRLKRGMKLDCDPTVIYGLGRNFNGNLRKEDLKKFTPYNTYLIRGLPPGPIANPGIDSIRAALYPAPVPYLYFVSKNNGTHYFSITFREHQRAVMRYQKKGRRRDVRQGLQTGQSG